MLRKTKKIIPLVFAGLSLATPMTAFAETLRPKIGNADLPDNIFSIINALIRFILVAAFIIAFVMLVVGGVRWILAGGDEKAVEKARSTITAALIGLVVTLVAFALIRLVEIFFGINLLGQPCVPQVGGGCQNIA